VPDAASSSSGGAMARPPKRTCPPSRGAAGVAGRGRGQPSLPKSARVTMPVAADEYNHRADGENPEPV
jgi:hypothetical protein